MGQLGYTMKQFYTLYDCEKIGKAMTFSFEFNSFLDNIVGLNGNIKEGHMKWAKYTKKYSTSMEKSYYPPLMNSDPVKNTYTLKNNKIITGPNAAGKTTLIKSSIINILLS